MLRRFLPAAVRFCTVLISAAFFTFGTAVAQGTLDGLETGLTDLVYRLSRSVVTVEASSQVSASRFGPALDATYQKETTTGIVIDSNGLILTAARPILGFDRLLVRYEGRAVAAELVAVDYQTELALLRAAEPGGVAPALDTRHACAGQVVISLGHAFGFRSSPALGFCAGMRDDGVLQFSIPSLGDRLGSGVFDLSGHLLGVVSELTLNDVSLVAAVPAYQIAPLVDYLLTHGDRQSGFAGITSQEIEIIPSLPLPRQDVLPAASGYREDSIDRGVVITSVVSSSPADRAGLEIGDLVYAVDHMPVNSAAGLANLVRQSTPGTRLQVDLIRQNQHLGLPLVVGRKSLTLAPESKDVTDSGQNRVVDSLRQALQTLRNQLNGLESRLNNLGRD